MTPGTTVTVHPVSPPARSTHVRTMLSCCCDALVTLACGILGAAQGARDRALQATALLPAAPHALHRTRNHTGSRNRQNKDRSETGSFLFLTFPLLDAHLMNRRLLRRRTGIIVLVAAFASFVLSVTLWFTGSHDQGLFVGLWVPSILSLGSVALQLAGDLGE